MGYRAPTGFRRAERVAGTGRTGTGRRLWAAAAGWLRAENRPDIELWCNLGLTLGLIASTVILAPCGLTAIAPGYLATARILMPVAARPALVAAFGRQPELV